MTDEAYARTARAASSQSIARCAARSDVGNRGGAAWLLTATDRTRQPTALNEVVAGSAAALKSSRSVRYRAMRNIVATGPAPLDGGAEALASSPISGCAGVTGNGARRIPSSAPPRISCDHGRPARPGRAALRQTTRETRSSRARMR
jgi:hypothetical protein